MLCRQDFILLVKNFIWTNMINIYADEGLMLDSTSKDFLLVREEGSRQVKRNVAFYKSGVI